MADTGSARSGLLLNLAAHTQLLPGWQPASPAKTITNPLAAQSEVLRRLSCQRQPHTALPRLAGTMGSDGMAVFIYVDAVSEWELRS